MGDVCTAALQAEGEGRFKLGGAYFHTHMHARQGRQACGSMRVGGTIVVRGDYFLRLHTPFSILWLAR